MNSNLHPLFVHFPIALFTFYSLMEMIPSKTLRENRTFFWIKCTLLFLGFISVWPTLMSGDSIEHMFGSDVEKNKLVMIHSFWANASVLLYSLLAIAYFIEGFKKYLESPFDQASGWQKVLLLPVKIKEWALKNTLTERLLSLILWIQKQIFKTRMLVLLALLGFIALSITGALGGALVHGANVDPVVYFFYKIHKPILDSNWLQLYLD